MNKLNKRFDATRTTIEAMDEECNGCNCLCYSVCPCAGTAIPTATKTAEYSYANIQVLTVFASSV